MNADQKTQSAFFWTMILNIPFWALITMLPIILYKDLHATPLQVTTIIALKPLSAIAASYWGLTIHSHPERLVNNLLIANNLRFLPFLFIPWIESTWLLILFFAIYMMFWRGIKPAWMETLKQHVPENAREGVFAHSTSWEYLGGAIIPAAFGWILDEYFQAWRWIFPITAIVGIASTYFVLKIPAINALDSSPPTESSALLRPWKETWKLLISRPDFTKFQIGFMLGGAGLMLMQPAFPMFFVDVLNLSYTKMLLAMAVCKGVGYAISSPMWVKLFRKIDLFSLSSFVTILAGLFPFILISAQLDVSLFYIAYLVYGIMQSGSELSWHMSGPVFSKDQDSSLFSVTNVLTVGIRGCFAPFLGSVILMYSNSMIVMLTGAFLCFIASQQLYSYRYRLKADEIRS